MYIGGFKILQVVIYKLKYIDIKNSSEFFLSEPDEMKSCIFCVDTTNAGMRLCGSSIIRFFCCLRKLGRPKESAKYNL